MAKNKSPIADHQCGSIVEMAKQIAFDVLEHRALDECPQILVGPVCHRRDKGWSFVIASSDRCGFFTVLAGVGDERDLAERCRAAVILGFVPHRPIVVCDLDDELVMAQLAETIWPCPQTQEIRAGIERERREAVV
jgi:hypothetical protein